MAGLVLEVRLTPRAAFDRIDAARETAPGRWRLEARVRAVPEKGRANEALLRLLSDTLGLRVSAFHLEAGATSREKRLRVGEDGDTLPDVLRAVSVGGERRASRV